MIRKLSIRLLFTFGILVAAGLKVEAIEICQNFYPDVPYSSFLLPSEIPTMSCSCVGVKENQSCPVWEFLEGTDSASDLLNETRRKSSTACTSDFHFRVSPDALDQSDVFNFTVKCSAADNEKTVRLFIRKSLNNYKCNEDQDCLLKNQNCEVKGHCPSKHCTKVCRCVDPLPIFVDASPENCYPRSGFGEPCNYTTQCDDIKASVSCFLEENSENTTGGVCRCPDGFEYNGRHRSCLEVIPGLTQQSLTERIMIAVCCGIVGIFIFVFVSHICKRHLRHLRRRQNCNDATQDPSYSEPLAKRPVLSDKPPSYQESQQGEIPVHQLVQPVRNTQTDSPPETRSSQPGLDVTNLSPAVLDPSALQTARRSQATETDF